jgi:hypothetical protein
MLLNIFDERTPAENPVRLTLRNEYGSVALMVVDEDGLEVCTILSICDCSNDIHLRKDVDVNLGFKLDTEGRVKVRKEKTGD